MGFRGSWKVTKKSLQVMQSLASPLSSLPNPSFFCDVNPQHLWSTSGVPVPCLCLRDASLFSKYSLLPPVLSPAFLSQCFSSQARSAVRVEASQHENLGASLLQQILAATAVSHCCQEHCCGSSVAKFHHSSHGARTCLRHPSCYGWDVL